MGPQIKESIKAFWAPGLLFEELDLAYVGVVDGHDVGAVRSALIDALAAERPVVVHVKTIKGKGFEASEHGGLRGMERWHAVQPAAIVERKPAPAPAPPESYVIAPRSFTEVFGQALVRECRRDDRICGITAAMNTGTGLDLLQDAMPDRYYDVGIAEQHAVLFAAGHALSGMKPVVAIYSTFLQRAFDQIVHDVCLQNLDVVFAMDRAGLVGADGPTHHGAFDVSYLRCLPNIVLMAPRNEALLVDMLHTALEHDGPVALRYPRGTAPRPAHQGPPRRLEIGRGEVLRRGERVALLGYGAGVSIALGAADRLHATRGIAATVADARFAKPLDVDLIVELAAEHDVIVSVEDNVLAGGFGSALAELMLDRDLAGCRLLRCGLPDRYVAHGDVRLLRKDIGLTPASIADRVGEILGVPPAAETSVVSDTTPDVLRVVGG
jgi:1-deoxy-D-xylulose-5-phosphate synthase